MELRLSMAMVALTICACGDVKDSKPVDAATAIDAPTVTECPVGVAALCSGADLVSCDGNGGVTGTQTCALGCNTGETRCNRVTPSNNLAAFLDEAATLPELTLVGNATIDTDAQTVVDTSGARAVPNSIVAGAMPILVLKVRSLTAASITVIGARALAIVSDGDVAISGVVSVSASLDVPGSGAVANEIGCRGGTAAAGNANGTAGGGGGGFGTAGGRGGTGGSPVVQGGTAGGTAGTPQLIPLRGGCAGGRSSTQPATHFPGAGGGAIQIVSNTSISIADGAGVAANGGGARTPTQTLLCLVNTPCGVGTGGGSGGAILLEAPAITIAATGGLYANGGGATCRVFGPAAENGKTSDIVALGQVCGTDTGSGGNGAAGATAATVGGNGLNDDPVGGGGGGGHGRIRINVPAGTTFTPTGTVTPGPTVGVLEVR